MNVEGKKCDIIQLYGTDGVGGVAKAAYVGQITPTVNDVGGVDEILEMTATVVQNTVPKWVTDQLTVVDNEDGKLLYNDKLIRKVAKIAKSKKVGLKWGGDWKSIVDTPHFYLGKWGSTTKKLMSTYGSFDKFKKTWTGKLRCNTYLRKGRLFTSKKLMTIQKGETVRILWKSKVSRVAKIEYAGKYGFIRLKNLA